MQECSDSVAGHCFCPEAGRTSINTESRCDSSEIELTDRFSEFVEILFLPNHPGVGIVLVVQALQYLPDCHAAAYAAYVVIGVFRVPTLDLFGAGGRVPELVAQHDALR